MRFVIILLVWLVCVLSLGKAAAESVLMFSADWCKYCQLAKKDMLENADEVDTWAVEVIDTDVSKELVKEYGVKSLPTFIYLNDAGEELDRQVGYKGYRQLKRWVEKNKR
ncbi:thioredoxin [bacterium]|nr:thioredoxin [bacterium]